MLQGQKSRSQGCHKTKKEPGEAKKELWALAARTGLRSLGPRWC